MRNGGMTAALLVALFGVFSPANGSTVVPMQLRGLKAVGVSVEIACDDEAFAREVRGAVDSAVRSVVAKVGMSIDDSAAAWLTVAVTCGRAQSGAPRSEAWRSASILVEVAEPVTLARDPSVKVAGGGAVTWIMDSIASGAGDGQLREEVVALAEWMLDHFRSGYEQANSASGRLRDSDGK